MTDRDDNFIHHAEDAIEYLELARNAMRLAAESNNWDANFAGVIGKIEVAVKMKHQKLERAAEYEARRKARNGDPER